MFYGIFFLNRQYPRNKYLAEEYKQEEIEAVSVFIKVIPALDATRE